MSRSNVQVAVPLQGGPTDPSHDDNLRRGIIATAVSRNVARTMIIAFLLIIGGVPIAQAIAEQVKDEDSSVLDLFRHLPTKERLRQFEKALEDASYPKDYTQQRMQLLLTTLGRVGNKNAVCGQAGWLFYKPGITYLGGPPFLDPGTIETRERGVLESGEEALHADPTIAIFEFADALRARGIRLVLLPVPDKAMLQPRELHGRIADGSSFEVARASSWQPFVDRVRAHGVTVFDPTPNTVAPGDAPRFLVQDTHWTPKWMEAVAGDLAKLVGELAPSSAGTRPGGNIFHSSPMEVTRVGDIVGMLKLPDWQTAFAPTTVIVNQVRDAKDEPWQSDESADVLLLGDSFTNIFSAEPMGWGVSAGLGPHLALALGRGVDVIAQNDSGAFATRQTLARELDAGSDRLAGKRVVIWEFASRELAVGDWKPIVWRLSEGH